MNDMAPVEIDSATRVVGVAPEDPVAEAVEGWQKIRPDLDFTSMAIFGRLSRIVAAQRSLFNARHAEAGLSAGAFDILANLRRVENERGKIPTEIAKSSILSVGSISQKLQKLVEQGLVCRATDSEDRRLVYFRLTQAGRELIDSLIECHLRAQKVLLSDLPVDDLVDLEHSLAKLQETISTMHDAASAVPIRDCTS